MLAWVVDLILYGVVATSTFLLFADHVALRAISQIEPGESIGSAFCSNVRAARPINECVSLGDSVWYTTGGRTILHSALLLSWSVGIHVVLQGLTGGSLGKLVAGVRVVRADGSRPGVGRALVRSVLWVVDGLPCCMPLLGLITMLSTGRRQRVGDQVARTFVVRAADCGNPVVLAGPTPAGGGSPTHPGGPLPAYRPPQQSGRPPDGA